MIQLELAGNKELTSMESILEIFEEHKTFFLEQYNKARNSAASIQEYIARLYNEGADLFAAEQSEKALTLYASFLRPILEKYRVKTVLDCACGTGNQAIALATAGYTVTGSDISSGMLRIAQEKAARYQMDARFLQADFCRLEEALTERFDAVICMTNSLSHLISEADIAMALGSMYRRLKENGIVLIELFNYDGLLEKQPRWLPLKTGQHREAKEVTTFYVFDYLPGDIVRWFVVYFEQEQPCGKVRMIVNIFDSRGIRKELLREAMADAGFENIVCGQSLSPASLLYRGERWG